MIIRRGGVEFVKQGFDLGVRFQGIMGLVACGLCLLKNSIHMQILYCGMDFQLLFQLLKQSTPFPSVEACKTTLEAGKSENTLS